MKIETSEEELQVVKMIAEMQGETPEYSSNSISETNITATKGKILIQATDASQTVYVEAEIKTSTGVKQEERFGIKSNDLAMVLRALRGSRLKMETTKNELKIQAGEGKEKSELTLYLEPAHDLDTPAKTARQVEHTQIVKIEETRGFRTALNLAGLIDDKVQFKTTKDNIFLITASGIKGTFQRRIKIKSGIHTKGLETVSALDREQLLQVVKAKASEVQLHLANNKPILIEYELGQAKTRVWVASRVMEYSEPTAKEEEIEEGATEEAKAVIEAVA